jgi:uncharacterized protein DUF3168
MTLTLPVDVEWLLHDYLVAQPELAALVGTRVSTALPQTPVYPLVLITRVGGTLRDQGYLDRPLVFVEAWAAPGKHGDAVAVMATVRALLRGDRLNGSYPKGKVSGADEIAGPRYQRDPPTNAERFVLTVQLFTKAA